MESRDEVSLAYTPGSGTSLRVIVGVVLRVRDVTIKNNSGAVVSDESAVFFGPRTAIPVIEGKAMFSEFAGIAAPICVYTRMRRDY